MDKNMKRIERAETLLHIYFALFIFKCSQFGSISQDLSAETLISKKRAFQPCLGDFHLQYNLEEKVFAPIILIKTTQENECFISSAQNRKNLYGQTSLRGYKMF